MANYVTCNICWEKVPLADFRDHLRDKHDISSDLKRWPDGQPVIVDSTLEPSDFKE